MRKVLIKKYNNWLPSELVGKIVTIDEDYRIVSNGVYDKVLLDKKDISFLRNDEPDEFLNGILRGGELSEDAVEMLFWEYDDLCIKHYRDDNRRWSCLNTKILNIYGRYFVVEADLALTESGEHMYPNTPYEVEFKPRLIHDVIFELTKIENRNE